MSGSRIALLGAVAGFTIYLALPLGRVRNAAPRLRAGLIAVAIGVLVFLVWDVLTHAWEPTDAALSDKHWGTALVGGAVPAAGLAVGLAGLVRYDRWAAARRAESALPHGPGAADTAELTPAKRSQAGELALMIATGIGLHNLAEGLAIGNSAARGRDGPRGPPGHRLRPAQRHRRVRHRRAPCRRGRAPDVDDIALAGLIGGGPTFLGTVLGRHLANDTLSIAFLGLAAGSILYVVIELLAVARRASATKELTTWCILLGLFLGFATDAVVTAAGV